MLVSILATLAILGLLIFVHELGHFIACRLTGVTVERFSIGFGPELFHFVFQGTRISLSLIPFGGFVKPKGENQEAVDEKKGLEPDDYLAKGRGERALIVSAGVFMNLVLAFVIFFSVFVSGRPILQPVIGELMPGYPAERADIRPGDRVLSVDAQGVADWGSLTLAILTHGEGPLRLEIEREGRIVHAEVTPREETAEEGRGGAKRLKRIGIRPSREYRIEKLAPLAALAESARTVAATTVLTCRVLGGLVTGEISVRNIAGPVGIVAIAGETAKEGILSLLNLTALLSVNLAVINLLPIPALDGGHLLFILIETLRRKALDRKLEERITQAGFSVLIVLMVLIVLNDFQNFDVIGRIRGVFGR